MKRILYITKLAVVALLYGLCGITQAVERVIDFDGIADPGGFTEINTTYEEADYTVTFLTSSSTYAGGILDSAFGNGNASPFTGGVLAEWEDGSHRITRSDAGPFDAISLAVGCYGALSTFTVTGNITGGGSVMNTYTPAVGTKTTVILSGFTNLESLDITSIDGAGAGAPLVDEITLEAELGPNPRDNVSRIRVFLQGGQSNADGRAPKTGQLAYTDVDLFYRVEFGNDGTLTTLFAGASETGAYFGPELSFGRRISDLLGCDESNRVAIVKYANGGTELKIQWKAGGDATTTNDGPEYVIFQQAVSSGLAALSRKYTNATINVEGMIWMQGETDAWWGYTNEYFGNLTNFISDVRQTYGTNLPFIVGRLSDAQTYLTAESITAIKNAQTAVASADPRVGLVSTDLITLLGDHIHFDAEGQLALGRAFAQETAYLLWVTDQLSSAQIDAGSGAMGADPDGDGIVNSNEFFAGTQVMDTNSQLSVSIELTGSHVVEITHPSSRGRLYAVEASTNLVLNVWTNLITEAAGITGETTHTLTNHSSSSFYRVSAALP